MKIEVVTEGEYLGTIIGDVNRRRGQVTEQGQKGNQATVVGLRAAVRDVRLHQLPALGDERPRHVHDGVRPLLRSAAGPRAEAHGRRGLKPRRNARPRRESTSRAAGRAVAGTSFASSAVVMAARALIGISGWRYSPWRGEFYPPGLPQRDELEYAAAAAFRRSSSTAASIRCSGPNTTSAGTSRCRSSFVFADQRLALHHAHEAAARRRDGARELLRVRRAGARAQARPVALAIAADAEVRRARLERFLDAVAAHDEGSREAGAPARRARRGPRAICAPRTIASCGTRSKCGTRASRRRSSSTLLREHNVALVVADTAGRWPLLEDVTARLRLRSLARRRKALRERLHGRGARALG